MRLIDADALLEAICKKYFVGDSTAAKLIKDAQTIKHEPIDINEMVNRFLSWKLPENFSPDAGISFTPEFNKEYMASLGKPPMRHEPIGTNLFDAVQAKAMIEYLLSNAPTVQREGWVSVPIEPTEEMIRKALSVEFPGTYKTHLRNPANGPKTTKDSEAQILRVTKQYAAFIQAAPKE